MKKIKSLLSAAIVIIVFSILAIASVPTQHTTYRKPKPQPCTKHQPLYYSPVLVKVFISGTYTLKDLTGAQRDDPPDLIFELNALTPNKYKLVSGETPNLNLYITYNTDNYQHFGASVTGYVYDDNFSFTLDTNYSSDDINGDFLMGSSKILKDIASRVNAYITLGWCKNCPLPCVIN
ncbi:MAG TPA: hypothetical protein VET23_05515 [Chitinophagaceae bacterium]|nr:hypothetical protein [Chitinophagaceae bacterium]